MLFTTESSVTLCQYIELVVFPSEYVSIPNRSHNLAAFDLIVVVALNLQFDHVSTEISRTRSFKITVSAMTWQLRTLLEFLVPLHRQ